MELKSLMLLQHCRLLWGFILGCLLLNPVCFAHDLGDGAHLTTIIEASEVEASEKQPIRWSLEITVQELLVQFPEYDIDENGRLTPVEYGAINARQVADYVLPLLEVELDHKNCPVTIARFNIITHSRADYLQFPLQLACKRPQQSINIHYNLFFAQNPYHQGTWTVILNKQPVIQYFWEDERERSFLLQELTAGQVIQEYLFKGVHHILNGFDHVLFLLSLLLPAVLIRAAGGWQPVSAFKPAAINVAKIVTVFTLAHSLTLSLAVLKWIPSPNPVIVESIIALSIVFMALHNLKPFLKSEVLVITFVFGLVHGFGFASVLLTYPLSDQSLVISLLAFNIGVELGQLAIALIVVPGIYRLRQLTLYQNGVAPVGSVLIALIGSYWFIERAFL